MIVKTGSAIFCEIVIVARSVLVTMFFYPKILDNLS